MYLSVCYVNTLYTYTYTYSVHIHKHKQQEIKRGRGCAKSALCILSLCWQTNTFRSKSEKMATELMAVLQSYRFLNCTIHVPKRIFRFAERAIEKGQMRTVKMFQRHL